MDDGFLSANLQLIESRPALLIGAAFVFALLESLAIVGIFVPGIVLLFLVGAVVGFDPLLFAGCWLAASTGALAGDVLSYWLGRRFRDEIPGLWPLSRRPELLAGGQILFTRHGGKGVFVGRFVGPIRPVVPLMAGMMGLRAALFLAFAVPACILWAPLYLLPGMLFGASLELAAEFAGRLVLLLLIVVLGTWFVVWVTRLLYDYTARRSGWWLKSLVRWTNRHPVAGRLVGDLLEPGRHQVLSVALLGLILGLSIVGLLSMLAIAPLAQPTWDAERQVASLAASLRSHFADPVFVALSLAGAPAVAGLLAGLTMLVLLGLGRTNAAWHWASATAGGWVLAELIAGLMGLLLPPAEGQPTLAEVPHRGFVLTTVVLGFFAVMLAKDLSARHRKWPYLLTSALLALIGFAHFYLGLASPLGLLVALALGLGWLALIGISYRSRSTPGPRPTWLMLSFYAAFLALVAVEIGSGSEALVEQTRLTQPERQMSPDQWLAGGWQRLPERRSRFRSDDRQRFDFQLAARPESFLASLEAAGWDRLPVASPFDLVRRLPGDAEAAQRLHLPRDFAGRPEEWILIREQAAGERRLVIRLWDSGTRLGPNPLWLGQVRMVQLEPGLAGLRRWRELSDQSPRALDALLAGLPAAEVVRPTAGPALINLTNPGSPSPARPAAAGHPGAPPGR